MGKLHVTIPVYLMVTLHGSGKINAISAHYRVYSGNQICIVLNRKSQRRGSKWPAGEVKVAQGWVKVAQGWVSWPKAGSKRLKGGSPWPLTTKEGKLEDNYRRQSK